MKFPNKLSVSHTNVFMIELINIILVRLTFKFSSYYEVALLLHVSSKLGLSTIFHI